MNTVTLSDDRKHMVVNGPGGQVCTVRSAREGGFTQAEEDHAKTMQLSRTLQPNQVVTLRRITKIPGWVFYLHWNTGPPTWWFPRVGIKRDRVKVGWLRGMVAVSWRRLADD